MRKYFYYLGLSVTVLALGICMNLITSCEGPEGPPGIDANATCTQCHNDESVVLSRIVQYNNSKHGTGTTFERSEADCAGCHTNEGFLERMEAGTFEASVDVLNPTPVNCRTCHTIHVNFDSTDFAIRYPDPVKIQVTGETIDLSEANICVNCHQPREYSPALPDFGGADVSLTSSRWGPHHGTESTVLWGIGAYEIPGSESYADAGSNPHASETEGCVTCHMATPYGKQAGGHTLNMGYTYHNAFELNTAGCMTCHTDEDNLLDEYEELEAEVEMLLDSLTGILDNAGILAGIADASSSSPFVLTADQAGAFFNLTFIEEDGSYGVHNPEYVTSLLKNSIESLSK